MRYSEDTIYICGSGKTAETNPITQTQSLLVISLVIRKSDGMVLSAELLSLIHISNPHHVKAKLLHRRSRKQAPSCGD